MSKKRDEQSGEPSELGLPRGVSLLRTFKAHKLHATGVAFDPTGQTLASCSHDRTVKLWDAASGSLLHTLRKHRSYVWSIIFDPTGRLLASGSIDGTVKLWDVSRGELLRTFTGADRSFLGVAFDPKGRVLAGCSNDRQVRLWEVTSGKLLHLLNGHEETPITVEFDPTGKILASGGSDRTVKLWEVTGGKLLRTLEGHKGSVFSLTFDKTGHYLLSGGSDGTVKLWEVASGRLLRTLEGHTESVDDIALSVDGRLLASKSRDGTFRLWSRETWETVAVVPEPATSDWLSSVAFHPTLPVLASIGSGPTGPSGKQPGQISLWKLDFDLLLGKSSGVKAKPEGVHHTTAKIVLVGDSGVGKTGLGWRLAHGEFKEHASTHGQQFWVVEEVGTRREDGTECEAIVWDLAGQPDYRLTHALFLDDADLALVLFDPTHGSDPLHGVEFWLKQLRTARKKAGGVPEGCCPTILVGARIDRGEGRLTQEELEEFCRQRGIGGGYLATSASVGTGLEELLRRMKELVAWAEKPATVTTVTFKRIKDHVLGLKESPEQQEVIVGPEDLRARLQASDEDWKFTNAEMLTAVGHLANYGYVRVLRTSKGEERVLLAPELLNNLAASFVLEARRNQKGLGSLEEKRLLEGGYSFPELEKLTAAEHDILLDSAVLLFLEHNVCFRETALGGQSYLVFPELINLKKPLLEDEQPTEDGVAYTVAGAVENVYASLVVLLGHTQTFTRTDQWRNQARYEVGDGLICGFRQDVEREGELDFVLYFGTNVGRPVRTLFQGLFESFLARRNLSVFRYEAVVCSNGHALNRGVVREQLGKGHTSAFCPECGERLALPKADEPIQLTQTERRKVEEQQRIAARRSRFEQAVFQVMSYVEGQKMKRPACFISYAWGNRAQERWVERSLATDLQKAGIGVVLDRWENARVGASVSRFVERIEGCDLVVVVGTPLYREKYDNKDPERGYVTAAEFDIISNRLLDTEREKQSVLPVLLAGERKKSFPPLLHGKVCADFREEHDYFTTAFDLILSIYDIPPHHQAVADLRESLRESVPSM